jgi:ABC-type bacteriocin/lantibiotic exporter with double-glycine peptidase domain
LGGEIGQGTTILAISTRRITFHQADQIIVLKEGMIESSGPLAALLESSEEMRHLYQFSEAKVNEAISEANGSLQSSE